MNEFDKNKLIEKDIKSIENRVRHAFNQGYEAGLKHGKEQEPKTGHWIEHDCESLSRMGYYRCSECNHGYQRYERGVRKSEVPYIDGQKYELHRIDNFCPNCGAKMEGEGKHEGPDESF